MTKTEVLRRIEDEVNAAGSAAALAGKWHVAASYLSDVRKRKRLPGPRILKALKLSARTEYHSAA